MSNPPLCCTHFLFLTEKLFPFANYTQLLPHYRFQSAVSDTQCSLQRNTSYLTAQIKSPPGRDMIILSLLEGFECGTSLQEVFSLTDSSLAEKGSKVEAIGNNQ